MLMAAGAVTAALIATAKHRRSSARLAGKVAVITGGSRGFGLALAAEFARAGARVVLTARDPAELDRARKSLLNMGIVADESDVATIPCDLTDPEQSKSMIALVTERFGRIDVLVNNAGKIAAGPVENQPLSAYKDAIESNYYCALHTTLAVLPQMLERGSGSIVNIASIGGKIAIPHLLPYTASKFALVGFSQGLTAELRTKGIRVTTVCPGLMRTGSHLHAEFTGNRQHEYRWFSLGASLPGVSTSARRAARAVIHATVSGRTELIITPQAVLASKLAPLAPASTAWLLSRINASLLPAPVNGISDSPAPGYSVRQQEIQPLTGLGEAASYEFNERGRIASGR
ncbi:3-oxoacyl-[acyl-carrier protein] reductase [Acidisarcina polymorpha]|uniref:3-oxoacyl-[acyl-carrier protein] reductase n=2 Tax=Acidisarcina polymorpha TaxID=2211140 RepID=A0A2Z5G696_9BACT|nr:3-oxoacyl-[acyl-carrier protein] reductase [Acidisarcina polymorpha]